MERMESERRRGAEAKGGSRAGNSTASGEGLDAEELVDKREYKLKRRLQSQTLRHMVTFLITVRSPEVVIRSAIISPSKYSRHESSIRDVEIACGARGYLPFSCSLLRNTYAYVYWLGSKFKFFASTTYTNPIES
jgi:hypothetical protein